MEVDATGTNAATAPTSSPGRSGTFYGAVNVLGKRPVRSPGAAATPGGHKTASTLPEEEDPLEPKKDVSPLTFEPTIAPFPDMSSASSSGGPSSSSAGPGGAQSSAPEPTSAGNNVEKTAAASPPVGRRDGNRWIMEETNVELDLDLRKHLSHSERSENLEKLAAQVEQMKNRKAFLVSPIAENELQRLFSLAQTPEIKSAIMFSIKSQAQALENAHERTTRLLSHHKTRMSCVPKPAAPSAAALAERQRQEVVAPPAALILERNNLASSAGAGWSNAAALSSSFGEWDEHLRRTSPKLEEAWKLISVKIAELRAGIQEIAEWSSTNSETQVAGERAGIILADCSALGQEEVDSELSIFVLQDYKQELHSYEAQTAEISEQTLRQGLPEKNPFTVQYRRQDPNLQFHRGSDAVSRPKQAFRPKNYLQVREAMQALFNGGRGGAKMTWDKLLEIIDEKCTAEQLDCLAMKEKLDTFRSSLQDHLFNSFFPQYFGKRLIKDSDDKLAEFLRLKTAEKEKAQAAGGSSSWQNQGKRRRGGKGKQDAAPSASVEEVKDVDKMIDTKDKEKGKPDTTPAASSPQEIQFAWFKYRIIGEVVLEFQLESDHAHRLHPETLVSENSRELLKTFAAVAYALNKSPALGVQLVQNTTTVSQLAAEEKRKKAFYTMKTAVQRLKNARIKEEKKKDDPAEVEKTLRQQILDLEAEKQKLLRNDYTTLSGLLGKGKAGKDTSAAGAKSGGKKSGGKSGEKNYDKNQQSSGAWWKTGGRGAKGEGRGKGGKKGGRK